MIIDRKDRLELLAIFDKEIPKDILDQINTHDGSKQAERKALYTINSIKAILTDNYFQAKENLPSFIRNMINIAEASKKYENSEIGLRHTCHFTLYNHKVQESEFLQHFLNGSKECVVGGVMQSIYKNAEKNPTAGTIILKIYGDEALRKAIALYEPTEQPKEVKYNFDNATPEELKKVQDYHEILKKYAK